MKIAIQGHPTRGKEVIQILESLGGKNNCSLMGKYVDLYYYIGNNNKAIHCHDIDYVNSCKKYTLEEFEKEFPFKIGDKIKDASDNEIGIITDLICIDNILIYNVDFVNSGQAFMPSEQLKPYKEMKEERNITLTLDKAKEWYKKGGELKEVALQAYSEEELNPLPRSWEEFCENYPIKPSEAVICTESTIVTCDCSEIRDPDGDREICPSKKSAEAHLAIIQLEQLRDCWRQDWEPDWNNAQQPKYYVTYYQEKFKISTLYETRRFLSFPTKEIAEEFLKCFRDLIEKAGDLI